MEDTKFYGGCDIGSTYGKAVILNGDEIAASAIIRSEIDPADTAVKVLERACSETGLVKSAGDLSFVIGTGYGRNEVPFADENTSEICCHAAGVHFCRTDIRTIIDIGGQDVKAISLNDDGSVAEFVMNDKCAAGTGRFLEMMTRIFNMELDEFSELSLNAKRVIPITSQCSVFAETEVISLISKKNPAADIAAGIQASVAKRSYSLLKRVGIRPKLAVTGGCSKNRGLIKALSKMLRMDIEELPIDPQLMGALGAAAEAKKRSKGAAECKL